MLDIFGSDDKKKEDLRENMDKIRDLVEDQGQGTRQRQDRQQGSGQDQPAPPPQQDRPQPPQQEGGDSQQRQRGQQRAQGGQQEQGGQEGTDVEMTRPHREAGDGQRTSSRQVQQRGQDQGQQGRQQDQDAELDVAEDEIPEPPETREIEVPDIQKGPLFIRVRKFKEAKQMVSRMRELNSDMETQMGGLRNTLEEDRESTRRLNDAMKRLQDSMNTIRDIVSPG